eukprot:TRINITY_DN26994_c0_g1_i1.p1 TRINITY_DN26994_c0_g1~~TRINITY_DN26994_c0_g1_i1.p1  ORF type:complete len:139 (-),score=28.81 TRINITY_DN26994_c0_g1_i1:82-498(-)
MDGLIFHGSLEEVIQNQNKFIKKSIAFAKKKHSEFIGDKYLNNSITLVEKNNTSENPPHNENTVKKEEGMEEKGNESRVKEVKIHSCEECSFKEKNLKRLRRHITSEHIPKEKEKAHSCGECTLQRFQSKEPSITHQN